MLTNYYTLLYLASDLQSRLPESAIVEAFSQEKEQLILRFSNMDDALIISCDRVINTLYLRQHFARARSNSVNVLARCLNQTIVAIQIHPVDRVIQFTFKSGERLDARFFGAKANVVLIDKNETVLDAFKDAKSVVGTKAEYRTGEIIYDIDALRRRLATPQLASLATILREEFPTLGATLVKEVLFRANLPAVVGAMSVGENQIQAIQGALSSVLKELAAPQPRVYLDDTHDTAEKNSTTAAFSIIPLSHLVGLREERFDDIHTAIRFYVSRLRSRDSVDDEKRSLMGKLNQKTTKAKRTIEAVEVDLQNSNRAEEYQRFGNVLMANLGVVSSRAISQKLMDDTEEVEIPLQKELSPVQNAQRYFEKAKRSRIARQQASERLVELKASIAPAGKLLSLLEEVKTKEELKAFMSECKDELEEFGIGEKSEAREQLPFRIFTVDGGFEVWAGKSSKNNDQLTLKYAKPNDLWFHARGAAGSHVVLKVNTGQGEPGKKAKEQAASIAAYYSKMKNAKMVPVAMTERKYVRKPKGAAPGSVTIEREKVIFAEPALPHEKHNH